MMNWQKLLMLLLFILLTNNTVKAQELLDTIIGFERKLFNSTNNSQTIKTYYDYAIYLKKEKKFAESKTILEEAYSFFQSKKCRCDTTSLKIFYELQLSSYYLKDNIKFSIAYNQIRNCPIKDDKVLFFSDLLNVFLFLDLGEWQDAKELSSRLFQNKVSIDSIFAQTENYKLKFVKKGKLLAILPGMGQYYAGFYKEGTVSVVLCSLLGGGLYFSIMKEAYFLAGLAVFPILFRTWTGGRIYTENQINYLNQKKIEASSNKIKKQLLNLAQKTNSTD